MTKKFITSTILLVVGIFTPPISIAQSQTIEQKIGLQFCQSIKQNNQINFIQSLAQQASQSPPSVRQDNYEIAHIAINETSRSYCKSESKISSLISYFQNKHRISERLILQNPNNNQAQRDFTKSYQALVILTGFRDQLD